MEKNLSKNGLLAEGEAEVPIDDSLSQAIAIMQREFKRERLADEILGEWLLPRITLTLRRSRAQRVMTEAHDACFAEFEWASRENGWGSLPALPEVVALWLQSLADFGTERGRPEYIRIVAEAISWRHRNAGLADPTASDVVDAVLADLATKEKLSEQPTEKTSKPKRPKKAKAKNGD
jgi:hypothetical protein